MKIVGPSSQISHVERHVEGFSKVVEIDGDEAEEVVAAEPSDGRHRGGEGETQPCARHLLS